MLTCVCVSESASDGALTPLAQQQALEVASALAQAPVFGAVFVAPSLPVLLTALAAAPHGASLSVELCLQGLDPMPRSGTTAVSDPRVVWPGGEAVRQAPRLSKWDLYASVQLFAVEVLCPRICDRKQDVLVFAPLSFFRLLLGVDTLPAGCVHHARLVRFPVPTRSHHEGKNYPPLVPVAIPMATIDRINKQGTLRKVLSCAGNSLEDLYTQRIHHTLTLALTPEHADSLVVFSENVGGYDTWQKAVASFHRQLVPAVSADLRLRCVADWNALYTEDNFDLTVGCMACFGPGPDWHMTVITHDWHMPRTLFIYRILLAESEGPSDVVVARLEKSSVPSRLIAELRTQHVYDTVILSTRLLAGLKKNKKYAGYTADRWKQVQKDCRSELLRAGERMRMFGATLLQQHQQQPQSEAARNLLTCLHERIKASDFVGTAKCLSDLHGLPLPVPAALMALDAGGNTALHCAVSANALDIADLLLSCFGASPAQTNFSHDGLRAATPLAQAEKLGLADMCKLLHDWDPQK